MPDISYQTPVWVFTLPAVRKGKGSLLFTLRWRPGDVTQWYRACVVCTTKGKTNTRSTLPSASSTSPGEWSSAGAEPTHLLFCAPASHGEPCQTPPYKPETVATQSSHLQTSSLVNLQACCSWAGLFSLPFYHVPSPVTTLGLVSNWPWTPPQPFFLLQLKLYWFPEASEVRPVIKEALVNWAHAGLL